jgi:hypothetical protein
MECVKAAGALVVERVGCDVFDGRKVVRDCLDFGQSSNSVENHRVVWRTAGLSTILTTDTGDTLSKEVYGAGRALRG